MVGVCGPKACCTGAKEGCTGAKQGLGGAKDSWETFGPWVQNTFCTLSEPLLALLRFWAPVAGTRGRKLRIRNTDSDVLKGKDNLSELQGQFCSQPNQTTDADWTSKMIMSVIILV